MSASVCGFATHNGANQFTRRLRFLCSSTTSNHSFFSFSNNSPFFGNNWEENGAVKSGEASTLLRLCEDLDWETRVNALRREALLRETKSSNLQQISTKPEANYDEWDYQEAVSDLRRKASFQVAQEMAKNLKTSDFDSMVPKLAEQILSSFKQQTDQDEDGKNFKAGLAVVLTGVQGLVLTGFACAASENSSNISVPSWLGPSVLAFPVVSYLLFSLYRDKVNPEAKLTDFFFALGALVIVGNLVTSATLGVRLY